MSIITLKNVSKKFKNKIVLRDINLDIENNKMIGLIGKSGSGKTTFLRLLMGIYKPTQGKIILNKKTSEFKKIIGFASQDDSFYPRLTVEENLRYFGALYNIKKKEIK